MSPMGKMTHVVGDGVYRSRVLLARVLRLPVSRPFTISQH
jgi:hypothetical protein